MMTDNNPEPSVYPFLDTVQHAKKRAFLNAYCDTFDVSNAAKRTGINRGTHYFWLHDDHEYVESFRNAKRVAAETLEAELTRRALQGVRKLKFHQGKPIMVRCLAEDEGAVRVGEGEKVEYYRHYYEHDYSDVLGIFLMKGAMPEKYRERYEVHDGDKDINETIERELAVLANRETALATTDDPEPGGNGKQRGNGEAPPKTS